MNIAYLLNTTIPDSGATKAFLNILDEMSKHGVNPFVIVPDNNGIVRELKDRLIPTFVLNYRPSAYPHRRTFRETILFLPKLAARVFVNYKATKSLTTWLKEHKIDLVHSNTGVIRIGFDAAQKLGIPHIYHIREYGDLDFGIRYFPRKQSFHRQLGQEGSYSICITKGIQRYCQQVVNTSRVIYDGVFAKSDMMPKCDDRKFFFYMGAILYAKGVDILLDAYQHYAETTDDPIPLKIAGSTNDTLYFQQQKRFVEEHNLGDKVEFLGIRNDIGRLLKEAKALIIPSRNEGFGFCMPEAMQQGCLCIAHNTAGSKEQLDNALELTGKEIALRYSTTDELANLLTEVASRPSDDYLPYTQLAFKVVNQLYTKENNAKQIYEFYQYILNKTNH